MVETFHTCIQFIPNLSIEGKTVQSTGQLLCRGLQSKDWKNKYIFKKKKIGASKANGLTHDS